MVVVLSGQAENKERNDVGDYIRILLIYEPASHASHGASHASHKASQASHKASQASHVAGHASHRASHASHEDMAR